jgi:hypothetical protein
LANRIAFAQTMLEIVADDAAIVMSDEAHFRLSGCVKQNFRYWLDANPWQLHERPLHSEHVTVWCCVGSFGVIGPYFFHEDGHAVTVNSGCYVHMLRNFLTPEIKRRGINQQTCGFNKTGSPLILRELPWQLCEKCFLGMSFPSAVIFHGLLSHLT